MSLQNDTTNPHKDKGFGAKKMGCGVGAPPDTNEFATPVEVQTPLSAYSDVGNSRAKS